MIRNLLVTIFANRAIVKSLSATAVREVQWALPLDRPPSRLPIAARPLITLSDVPSSRRVAYYDPACVN
jgi:hypothetical protein